MPQVVLNHVSKEYANGVLAVDDVSFDVNQGEFLVLVGPSGCGKSTALRLVAGLERLTAHEREKRHRERAGAQHGPRISCPSLEL